MLSRLFPTQADNRFEGYRAALWLLGLLITLKLIMSVNSILNTRQVAQGADCIRSTALARRRRAKSCCCSP